MPFNINPEQLLNNLWRNRPDLQQNQNALQMINAITNNDQATGEQIANNILKQYGMTKEQALQRAQQFFSQRR